MWTSFPASEDISFDLDCGGRIFLARGRELTLLLEESLQVTCDPSFTTPDEENWLRHDV